jgi:hypothetical protein
LGGTGGFVGGERVGAGKMGQEVVVLEHVVFECFEGEGSGGELGDEGVICCQKCGGRDGRVYSCQTDFIRG